VPEQRAAVKAQYDLDNIRAQLEHSSVYTILYTSFWKEDRLSGSPQIRMKSEIRYLDESRDMLVILQSDITEVYEQQRQQQEQEAEAARSREQTRMLERIVHRIPAGLAVYSRQDGVTTVVIVNEYLARLAGMPESRILNHNLDEMIRDRIHPEDFETVSDGMRRLFADGSASFTYRTQTMTGEYRWITAAGQTEQEADGSERAYVLYTDASEEKKQEEEYDARIRELSAVNPNAIGIFHLNLTENKLVRLQSQMADALHLSEEDTADSFIDKCIAGMAYETDRAYCRSLYSREKLLADFDAHHYESSCDFRYPRLPDGEIGWGTTYVYLTRNPRSGDIEAVFSTIDSTEGNRGRQIMARIAEDDYDFFALIDVRRRTIHFANVRPQEKNYVPRATDDYEKDISRAIHALSDPSDVERCLKGLSFETIVSELSRQPFYVFPFTIKDENGQERRKQMRHEWLDETHDMILCTRVDNTAGYLQEQEQLRKMADALHAAESANQAKSQFLSRISHDIRTPLNAITSMTMFAREDADKPEQLSQDIDKIESSSKFLLSLISDILDISRIDSGNMELHPEPFTYEEYRGSLISMFEPLCKREGIELQVPEGRHDGSIVADKIRLNQISLNLVSNAIRYSHPGGKITILTGSTLAADGMLDCTLEVQDNGIGMSEKFQKIMFEPFTQEHDNPGRSSKITGTGLGLSLVKRITDLMGGTISVNSRLGEGTDITVCFHFPKAPDPVAAEEEQAEQNVPEILSGRVLLAEDNEINAEIAIRMLESFGLYTETAVNGREALKLFEHSETGWYDLILMDIQMPLMNGYEAAQAIRALPREDAHSVPIIALTADAFAADVQRSLAAGMNAHISKPIDPKQMREILTRFLAERI
jgi:signal transduction histidine kinase/PAS domain-containing protein